MTHPALPLAQSSSRPTDGWAVTALIGVQVVLAAAASVFVFFGLFDTSCMSGCRYDLTLLALYVMLGVSFAVPVASAAWCLLRIVRGFTGKWIAIAGIVVIVAVYFGCRALQFAAFGHALFV